MFGTLLQLPPAILVPPPVIELALAANDPIVQAMSAADLDKLLAKTNRDMERAAKAMEFMEAARLRDEIHALEARRKEVGK